VEAASGRRLRRWAVAGAVVALVAVGIWFATRPTPVAVTTAAAAAGEVEATVANTRAGTVKACRRTGLSPLMGGQVAVLNVKEGDRVKAGDLLLSLWNDDLEAQLALNQAQAKAAEDQADQACLLAEEAARVAARQSVLSQQGIATEEAFDKASTNAKAQQAACRAARGEAKVADATVRVARANLERTRLTAPFAGVVAEVNAELYEYVTPSPIGVPTPPAVDLIDDSCLYVSAPIDEVDAPRIRAGMPARITIDAFPDKRFAAHVRRVAPYVLDLEKQARTVEVEAALDDPASVPWMLPGLSADVEVILETRSGVTRVPTGAVLEGNRVYVLDPAAGRLKLTTFKPGLSNWAWTEVASGLAPGALVVTSLEREGLADGARARAEAVQP
jgi:HlyD family secretion protein